MKYVSVDDGLKFITRLSHGTHLIKVDLKSAYQVVPLHSQDRHLFGICWDVLVYVDQALPFGLCSAPLLFTALADAIGWALTRAGVELHIHYLDNFLFFLPPSSRHELVALPHILSVFRSLGVPVALHKVGPVPVVTFLGIVVGTARFELQLPPHEVEYIQGLVRAWRGRRSGRCGEFESILGHLSHAATVIRKGRIFLRRLFVILAKARSRQHLHAPARADLLWWDYFLQVWNGTMFFQQSPAPTVYVHTDASGTYSCGGVVLPANFFQSQWPESWANVALQ